MKRCSALECQAATWASGDNLGFGSSRKRAGGRFDAESGFLQMQTVIVFEKCGSPIAWSVIRTGLFVYL